MKAIPISLYGLYFRQPKTLSLDPIPFYSLIPQHNLIHDEAVQALKTGFEANHYIMGDSLRQFEAAYAKYHGLQYCLGVGSGYDALYLSLRSCNLDKDSEVIVPANTYIATWMAISHAGCKLIPVEPDAKTFTININLIEERISPNVRAIMPVHLYGHPCDMTNIMAIAKRHKLIVIEDNAQGHGALWEGKLTGTFGDINGTSFYPTKNLGALGDGGAITTSSETLIETVRRLRNYGFSQKNICDEIGVNSRLDELQASVLSIKLKHLSRWNDDRNNIASDYIKQLTGVGDIILPYTSVEARHAFHLFIIRTTRRDQLKEHLVRAGIETMIHYPIPPHLQKAYAHLGLKRGSYPVTELLADNSLSLPLWPGMTADQISYISDSIRAFYV